MSLIEDTYKEVSEYLGSKIYKEVRELLEKAKKYNEEQKLFEKTMNNSSVTIISEITHCRDCIHRPVYDEKEYDLIVPPYNNEHQDCACPYICQEDFYCSRMPDDDFYCKYGEKENE